MDAPRRSWWRHAAVAMATTVLMSCGGPTEAGPTCRDTVLAKGLAFKDSHTFAIAFSRALGAAHPELGPIVDEAVRYQRLHPDYESLSERNVDVSTTGLSYTLALTAMAASPDARTPEVIGHLADAARRGGMGNVLAFLHDDERYPSGRYGGAALRTLRDEWEIARTQTRRTVTWFVLCPGG